MYLFIAVLSVFVGLYSSAVEDDDITSVSVANHFHVPKYATYGSTVEMSCIYHVVADADVDHAFSWLKDRKLLYMYDKDLGKEKFVEYPEIHLNKEKTNNRTLVLQNVTEAATGTYACKLESSHPLLATTTYSGNMTVLPLNIPVNCNEGTELLWETLRQYYPDIVNSLPYVPDHLNCVNGTAP